MRILIHGLNFAPELTGIGKYTGELAAYLAGRGQEVHVVTASPYYPHWRIREGYSGLRYQREQYQGVEVYRCPLWVPRRPGGVTRVIHLASFALSSLPVMLGQARWKPQVVIGIAPAIAAAPVSLLAARLAGGRAWLHIQDFELDAALKLKMLPGLNIFGRLMQWGERRLLGSFDRVSTISQRMLQALLVKGVLAEKAVLLPNWVDERLIYPLTGPNSFREEWGIAPEQALVLYSGNMGHKQGLEVVVEAARLLREDRAISFVLCGEGAARAALEALAGGLPNLRFYPLQPVERLNELLNAADIHVLAQRAGSADLVMPSKLGGMLASGRPVIATAVQDTELGQVMQQAGVLVPPEDPQALAQAILSLRCDPERQKQLGARGRKYVEGHWAKDRVLYEFFKQICLGI